MLPASSMTSASSSNNANFIQKDVDVKVVSSKKSGQILSIVKGVGNTSNLMQNNATHLPYPKIGQFHNLVHTITQGKEYGEIPSLAFHGTVKLHGTNGAVAHDYLNQNTWTQSRTRVLTKGESDNKGFSAYVNSDASRPVFNRMLNLIDKHRCNGESRAVVYGEWCGNGIQKNVAVSNLPLMFIVFNIGLFDDSGTCRWLNNTDVHNITTESRGASVFSKDLPVFSAEEFKTWDITIDFSSQESINNAVNKLSQYTVEVEEECPVGKKFGVPGMGEGIVYKTSGEPVNQFMFKVKGEKHSETNVKVLIPVRPEKIDTAKEFVENTITKNRLVSVLDKLADSERNVKRFCLAVKKDVFSEEALSISENSLDKKVIAKLIDESASKWFLDPENGSIE